jgi:hypothetical protein
MSHSTPDVESLVTHLARSTELDPGRARRVVQDVLAWCAEDVDALVRRRHRELRAAGLDNPAAFAHIAAELPDRCVAAPRLTERQIRRVIYG